MMIPFLLCLGAFAIVLVFARMGMTFGAYTALSGMLSAVLGTFAGLRYWYLVSRVLGEREGSAVPVHFIIVFWALFFCAIYVSSKLRQNYTEVFESTDPSLVDRLLGWVFGAASGIVIMASVTMSISVAAPELWPGYRSDQLPVRVDRWPLEAYRFIETRFAGIGPKEPGHTLLPSLNVNQPKTPADFWQ
jgi:hypothetical protein